MGNLADLISGGNPDRDGYSCLRCGDPTDGNKLCGACKMLRRRHDDEKAHPFRCPDCGRRTADLGECDDCAAAIAEANSPGMVLLPVGERMVDLDDITRRVDEKGVA